MRARARLFGLFVLGTVLGGLFWGVVDPHHPPDLMLPAIALGVLCATRARRHEPSDSRAPMIWFGVAFACVMQALESTGSDSYAAHIGLGAALILLIDLLSGFRFTTMVRVR